MYFYEKNHRRTLKSTGVTACAAMFKAYWFRSTKAISNNIPGMNNISWGVGGIKILLQCLSMLNCCTYHYALRQSYKWKA
jgi:hypothetical protein